MIMHAMKYNSWDFDFPNNMFKLVVICDSLFFLITDESTNAGETSRQWKQGR